MSNDPLLTRLLNGAKAAIPGANNVPNPVPPLQSYADWPRLYQLYLDYYQNTGLYDDVTAEARRIGQWRGAIKGLRNPAARIVDFYVKHVWSGDLDDALPLKGASGSTEKTVKQIWTWSNWQIKKQMYIRQLAIYGDSFLKVVHTQGVTPNQDRIRLQQIDPRLVTEVTADDRGYVTYIRLDNHLLRTDGHGAFTPYTRTEVWDKATQMMRIYERDVIQYDLTQIVPIKEEPFSTFGIDFVPFVWTMFKDIGEDRGVGAFTLLLDKIDELNQAATRLHQILFRYNRPVMALAAAGSDLSGRPLPAPRLEGRSIPGAPDGSFVGDDDLFNIPGGADLKMMVPNIDYAAALNIVVAQLKEIETDAPELLYFRLTEMGDTSGRSIRHFLGPAIKSVEEVRANAEAGLIRAHQIAMTIGSSTRVFTGLGSFEKGDFDHSFEKREVIPISETDQAQINQDEGQAGVYWLQIGIKPEVIAERLGFKKADVAPPPPVTNPNMPTNTPQPTGNPPTTGNPPSSRPNNRQIPVATK